MRIEVIAVLLLGLAAAADAQSRRDDSSEVPQPSIGLPLPHIGLPLPSIGLPLPPMGMPPQQPKPTILDTVREQAPPRVHDRASRRAGGAVFLFVPAYQWPYLPGTAAPSLPTPQSGGSEGPPLREPAPGRLRIELQALVDPQIYVDGYFVGSVSDFNGEVTVEVGHHTIELRQDGYETLHIDMQVPGDRVVTYR